MTEEKPIYDFPLFKRALLRLGIDVGQTGGYTIVRASDVIFQNGHGNVEFENDKGDKGIFVQDRKGHYHQVFMYKRDYHLERYGKPRYHICQCETIQEFINSGSFKQHYRYANTEKVPVMDMDNYNEDTVVDNLPLCHYCADIMGKDYSKGMPVEQFVAILKEAGEAVDEENEVDIFGYVRNWESISLAYRTKHEFRCEQCGYQAETELAKRFIQVHHIDGDKLNNKENNLRCLCIKCHANVDAKHQTNFRSGNNADMLQEFEEWKARGTQYHFNAPVSIHIDKVDTLNQSEINVAVRNKMTKKD